MPRPAADFDSTPRAGSRNPSEKISDGLDETFERVNRILGEG